MTSKKNDRQVSAFPGWSEISLTVATLAVFSWQAPSLASLDQAATVETFTNRVFPEIMSLRALGVARIFIAVMIWAVTFRMVTAPKGYMVRTFYLQGSMLRSVDIEMKGMRALGPFSSWGWILIGTSFSLSAGISLISEFSPKSTINPWILRAALLSWELGAVNALLTTSMVTYILWPLGKEKGDTTRLRDWRTRTLHNGSIVFVMLEMCLMGGLPVRWSDVFIAPLFGSCYLAFSWYMVDKWVPTESASGGLFQKNSKVEPQFLYFFFDTTLGYRSPLMIFMLIAALMFVFQLLVTLQIFLDEADGGVKTNILAVLVVCALVCR